MLSLAFTHPLPLSHVSIGEEKSRPFEVLADKLSDTDIKALRYEDVGRASESVIAAFQNDPVQHYVRAGDKRDLQRINKRFISVEFGLAIRAKNKVVFTVHEGLANVVGTKSEAEAGGPDRMDKILRKLVSLYSGFWGKIFLSKEQKKRSKEIQSKFEALVKDNLGESINDMFYINLLATSPKVQGKGYGSALVAAVTSMADAQNRSTFLLSSNIKNTAFYNSCGFSIVAHATLGDDNPAWTGSPITVPLMVRKPQNMDVAKLELDFTR